MFKKVATVGSFTSYNSIHPQGVMNSVYKKIKSPNIYITICGRFTTTQCIIA